MALLRLTEHEDDVETDLRTLERDVSEMIDVHVTSELGRVDMGRLRQQLQCTRQLY